LRDLAALASACLALRASLEAEDALHTSRCEQASLALRASLEAGVAPEAPLPGAASAGNAAAAPPPAAADGRTSSVRTPCLPPAPVGGAAAARPTLPKTAPPPLRTWEALRCGADGSGAAAQLVRACAWERFGQRRLSELR